MAKISAKFKLTKLTKNTAKYDEVPEQGKPPVIGQQYVQQWALPNPAPAEITITVEFADE